MAENFCQNGAFECLTLRLAASAIVLEESRMQGAQSMVLTCQTETPNDTKITGLTMNEELSRVCITVLRQENGRWRTITLFYASSIHNNLLSTKVVTG